MTLRLRTIVPCILASVVLSSCAPAQQQQPAPQVAANVPQPPPAPREFRAAWIASVGNSNWPRRDRTAAEQKQDMIALLDQCVALNLNAVVLQIRPGADALYKSDLEPWSEYLTGTQGQPPSPYYDPMELWITEAHRRGLEFHAWFNPYRVSPAGKQNAFAPNSIMKTHPEIVRKYGTYLWMDPGEPLAAQHTLAVVLDVVRRYDIDGIHTDDYYYPYRQTDKATSKPIDFPDDATYGKYQQLGGKLARNDWRRGNINQLVEQIYTQGKKVKPWVKVGYAPFGIWKNNVPEGIKGMSQTDELYADPKLWLNKGWLDYLSPQLYWHIGGDQDFAALFDWWLAENTQHRHIWPGVSIGKNGVDEILDQLKLVRTKNPSDPGLIYWSVRGLFGPRRTRTREEDAAPPDGKDKGPWRVREGEDLGKTLVAGPYAERALVPASPWLDQIPPPAPIASVTQNAQRAAVVSLKPGAGEATWVYAIYIRYGSTWRFTTLPGGSPGITLNSDPTAGPATAVVVSAVDRVGNESARVTLAVR